MTDTKEKIEADLKEAMRQKAELKLSVLRMVSAAIHNREIEKRSKTGQALLTEDEIFAVLKNEMNKRKDAADGFGRGGRKELVEKEKSEAKIIAGYLPAELSDEDIEKIVSEVISGLDGVSEKDFGRVMGEVMKRAKNRASGDRVSKAVRDALQK